MNVGIPVKLFRPMTCFPHFQYPALRPTSLIAIIKDNPVVLPLTSNMKGNGEVNPSCFSAIAIATYYSDWRYNVLA